VTRNIAIRVDASLQIGTGHLKRCLSLVQALQEQGVQPVLITRALDGVSAQVLRDSPCPVHWLPAPAGHVDGLCNDEAPPHASWAGVSWGQDARETAGTLRAQRTDWLVVDHYAVDARWHDSLRDALGCPLLVIDDTADRSLSADVLLDHNWDLDHRDRYAARLIREPRWLTGPRFALLAPAYRRASRYRFNDTVRSLGIFMGGTDPGGITIRVLKACRTAGYSGAIEVVSTSANPHLLSMRTTCAASPGTTLTLDEPDLAAFFARHDLQIGAGGGATWERCCIAVPTIAIVVAVNQSVVVPALDRIGALRAASLPDCQDGVKLQGLPPFPEVLGELLVDPGARERLSRQAASLVDGRGAQRVALTLLRDTLRLRLAERGDAGLLHAWRNHPTVRAVSANTGVIAFDDHQRWLHGVLKSLDCWLFVAWVGELPVGSIRFNRLDSERLGVSLYLDPELLGLGLGTRLLLAGERQMQARFRASLEVDARVVAGNAASKRLFEASGYHGGPSNFRKKLTPLSSLPGDETTANS
jgi:UDP-2,4-diacetamido-2,4,6-trideoxy-beta-L-altropyranose hydrolase